MYHYNEFRWNSRSLLCWKIKKLKWILSWVILFRIHNQDSYLFLISPDYWKNNLVDKTKIIWSKILIERTFLCWKITLVIPNNLTGFFVHYIQCNKIGHAVLRRFITSKKREGLERVSPGITKENGISMKRIRDRWMLDRSLYIPFAKYSA